MSLYRNQLETWLQKISVKTERVLDIGGASNPVRARVYSWDVQECTFFDLGTEPSKVEYMKFDLNLPLTQFKGYESCFADEILNKKPNPFKFDAIFCLEVFEYIWNPVQAIKNIYNLMNNDSVAYISFPSIYPVHNPVQVDYLRYTKNVIQKYLIECGFTQIEITSRMATLGRQDLSRFYGVEGMHPVRNSELPFDIGYMVKARRLNN